MPQLLTPGTPAPAFTLHATPEPIRADFEGGVRSGVNGTPAFYVNGRRHDQAYDYDGLRAAIAAQLVLA